MHNQIYQTIHVTIHWFGTGFVHKCFFAIKKYPLTFFWFEKNGLKFCNDTKFNTIYKVFCSPQPTIFLIQPNLVFTRFRIRAVKFDSFKHVIKYKPTFIDHKKWMNVCK